MAGFLLLYPHFLSVAPFEESKSFSFCFLCFALFHFLYHLVKHVHNNFCNCSCECFIYISNEYYTLVLRRQKKNKKKNRGRGRPLVPLLLLMEPFDSWANDMEALKPSSCSGSVQLLELLFKLNWHLKERAVAITDSFMSEEKRHQVSRCDGVFLDLCAAFI